MNQDSEPTKAWAEPSPAAPQERHVGKLESLMVGAAVLFVFMVVAYGLNPTFQMIGLAVVCTAGLGLIPILFVSWLVGWVVISIWASFRKPGRVGAT